MLTLYRTLKVPGVDHVTLYRDDEDPHQFYMLPERPTIARDDDGSPLFTFVLYARDVDRLAPDEREIARAYLALTTQVAVSAEDEQRIRAHLEQMLSSQRSRGLRPLGRPVTRIEPKLSYVPVFLDGSVSFIALPEDMVTFTAGSGKPSLVGANLASFSMQFNQDGAEFFRGTVNQGIVPSLIEYSLTFAARIPAVEIRITGDKSEMYEQTKHYITRKYKTVEQRSYLFGLVKTKRVRTWLRTEFTGYSEFKESFHGLKIEVIESDFREDDPGADLNEELQTMAFDMLSSNILPSFFESAIEEATEAQLDDQRLKTIEKEMRGTIDITIRRSDVVQVTRHPNAQLAQALTPEEIKALTVYLDLGDAFFKELDVKMHANVNFEADPVFALKVFLEYDQQDEIRNVRVNKGQEFLFRSANEAHRFRQIMAKASDGSPKDAYQYWSELVYKDTGESIRIPASGRLTSRERELVISYQRLGFVKVNLLLGTMPPAVAEVRVEMHYPRSNHASARQSFVLNAASPTASYFTYTGHSGEPRPYRYTLTYVLQDGHRMDLPEREGTEQTLTVASPFETTITTRFMAQADFSLVAKLLIDARYDDPGNDFSTSHHAEFQASGDTSRWALDVRDPERRDFTYDVTIAYLSGASERKTGLQGILGETVPVGEGAVDALEVTVDAGLVDWTRYQRLIVQLAYTDEANGVRDDEALIFSDSEAMRQHWKVLVKDRDRKSYRYKLRFLASDAADNREVDWTESSDRFLVIQ